MSLLLVKDFTSKSRQKTLSTQPQTRFLFLACWISSLRKVHVLRRRWTRASSNHLIYECRISDPRTSLLPSLGLPSMKKLRSMKLICMKLERIYSITMVITRTFIETGVKNYTLVARFQKQNSALSSQSARLKIRSHRNS
jgi:hypothetical protein